MMHLVSGTGTARGSVSYSSDLLGGVGGGLVNSLQGG